MPKIALILLLLCSVPLVAVQQRLEISELARELAAVIRVEEPLFLELRTGEWTSALESYLRQELLLRGADIRESAGVHSSAFSSLSDAEDSRFMQQLLDRYALQSASLVQITMDIGWQTVEHRTFLSYRQERLPVYNFSIRQIALPGGQLTQIDSHSHIVRSSRNPGSSGSSLRWFEPIVASLGIASMIYLLWTTE